MVSLLVPQAQVPGPRNSHPPCCHQGCPMKGPSSPSTLSPSAQPSCFLPEAFTHPSIHSFPHQGGEAKTLREREKRQRDLEMQVPRWEQTLSHKGQGW